MTARAVLSGEHFMQGDHACAEGALAAGCRFFGGYPITPSTEIAERLAVPTADAARQRYLRALASVRALLRHGWEE